MNCLCCIFVSYDIVLAYVLFMLYACWFCFCLCHIFLRVERALVLWNFLLYFPARGTLSGIGILCYIFVYGTRSGIVDFCVIFFCMWNTIWYCVIFSACGMRFGIAEFVLHFFACGTRIGIVEFRVIYVLHVERILALWNFVLYLTACGTPYGIMHFCVTYFYKVKVLVEMIPLLLWHMCFIFSCCIFRVVLKSLHSLQQIFWYLFGRFLVRI